MSLYLVQPDAQTLKKATRWPKSARKVATQT
jgi:hypothetical protein